MRLQLVNRYKSASKHKQTAQRAMEIRFSENTQYTQRGTDHAKRAVVVHRATNTLI